MVVMAVPDVGNDDRRSSIGIRHQRFQAVFEDTDRVVTDPPGIERIDGLEPGVEVFAQCRPGFVVDPSKWNPDVRCQVDQQFAFATRVVDAREPALHRAAPGVKESNSVAASSSSVSTRTTP